MEVKEVTVNLLISVAFCKISSSSHLVAFGCTEGSLIIGTLETRETLKPAEASLPQHEIPTSRLGTGVAAWYHSLCNTAMLIQMQKRVSPSPLNTGGFPESNYQ